MSELIIPEEYEFTDQHGKERIDLPQDNLDAPNKDTGQPAVEESTHLHINTSPQITYARRRRVPEIIPSPPGAGIRRSARDRRPTTKLKDYYILSAESSKVWEPVHYREATTDKEWSAAIAREIAAINKNETWDIVDLPIGKRTINSKWIFKAKKGSSRMPDKLKARLVARGDKQIEGIDFFETFAPIV